jgi:hypothetical protein
MAKIVTKNYVVNTTYNGKGIEKTPYIYPKIETEDDLYNFILRLISLGKRKGDMITKVIAFIKQNQGCTRADLFEHFGLERNIPKENPKEREKPCPYGQIEFCIRKLSSVSLIQIQTNARPRKLSLNLELWDSFVKWSKKNIKK